MAYYFNTTLSVSFDDAVARTVAALKSEGFGVLTEIDVQKTLRENVLNNARRNIPSSAHQTVLLRPFQWVSRVVVEFADLRWVKFHFIHF